MKISASIYSDKTNDLETTLALLNANHVDMIHVDCKDSICVFDDIEVMKLQSKIPIDLHIITDYADKYIDKVIAHEVDLVTFQFEDLIDKTITVPSDFGGKLGLAITTETPIEVFEPYADQFDFILFMATIPGESGGVFDRRNFRRIRDFKKRFPGKKIHVDGGVNGEVSFILRNMGVYASVSGSYLFNASTIGSALLNLKLNEIESHFLVKDFMLDLDESPYIYQSDMTLEAVLRSMNKGKLGFTAIIKDNFELAGIIGNADLRNGLLTHIGDLKSVSLSEMINTSPLSINESATVVEMIRLVKNNSKTILYLPVVDIDNKLVGTLNFMNLIKGEI
ncbi:MAG: CBS domain-containing protein [Putridiphycobacter sp.]|nr:CBS domain-containing protein [Putridiphycobacter sp.]